MTPKRKILILWYYIIKFGDLMLIKKVVKEMVGGRLRENLLTENSFQDEFAFNILPMCVTYTKIPK